MIRFFDFFFAFMGLLFLFPLLILVWIIGWFDNYSPLFWQKRVGRNQKTFFLIKFRTMKFNTASIATHLIDDSVITPFGHFLRRTKIDEIPQLWNVLFGDMSLVGYRPCLLNQKKLIKERDKRGIFNFKPGITGLAQINNITMEKPILLAKTDLEMIDQMSLSNYFYYILKTLMIIVKN